MEVRTDRNCDQCRSPTPKGTPEKTRLLTLRGEFSRDTESWSGDFGGVGGEPWGCDRTPKIGSANRESPWGRGTRSVGNRRNHQTPRRV